MPITGQLLYQTDMFYKKGAPKKLVVFTGKLLCWSVFWDEVEIKLQAIRPDSNTDASVLNSICVLLFQKIMIIKKFLGKPSGQNDHYMINMGGQRPKIGGNWPLTDPYLQRCRKPTPGCNGLNSLDHVKYFFAIVLFRQKLPLMSH